MLGKPAAVPAQQGGQVIIRRVTYSLGGQAVATRVTGDPVSGNNGVFYIHTDHLGSTSLLTYYKNGSGNNHPQMGQVVPNTTARYYPFGGWSTTPTATLTDRGFTGHKHNNLGSGPDNLGLIYMNARYYVPGIGRFASADTLVPDPTNPQQFNRYTYTLNNPVRYADPTGHLTEDEIEAYFGFSSKQAMLDAGWNSALIDILWTEEFTWNSVVEYEVDGVRGLGMLALFQTGGSGPLSDDATFRGGFWSVYGGIEVTADVIFSDWASENTSMAQAESEYWQNSRELRKPPNNTPGMFVYSTTNFQGQFVAGALTVTGLASTGVGLLAEAPIVAGVSAGATFLGGGMTIADWLGYGSLSPTQRITIISPTPYNTLGPVTLWHYDTFFHHFAGHY